LVTLLKITKAADKSDTAKIDKLIMVKWFIRNGELLFPSIIKSFLRDFRISVRNKIIILFTYLSF
jgi:hypothetical protein